MTAAVNDAIAAGGQIQGKRHRQEDSWRLVRYADTELLAVVADGLGGHPAGDVASREGVRVMCESFAHRRRTNEDPPRDWLQFGIKQAHLELKTLQQRHLEYYGMATTMIALYRRDMEFWATSVGDSYLLLLRKGELIGLNQLHSEMGGVTSCVGFNLSEVDIADRLLIEAGDRFLLASDGIATLDPQEISGLLGGAADAPAAVKGLLGAIADADLPTQDNVTVITLFA